MEKYVERQIMNYLINILYCHDYLGGGESPQAPKEGDMFDGDREKMRIGFLGRTNHDQHK